MTIRVEFYTTSRAWHDDEETVLEFRWRLVGRNNEKGPPGGEAYASKRNAYLAAIDWLGVAQRSDLVVPDEADRLALARILHRQHPEVSEQAWLDQLDPDTVMEVSAPDLLRAARA